MRIYAQHMTANDISMLKSAVQRDKRVTLADALKDIYTSVSALYRYGQTVYTVQAGKDFLHVAQLTGKMHDIPGIHERLVHLARRMNKAYVDLDGRKGWKRALKPLDYHPHKNLLRYTL